MLGLGNSLTSGVYSSFEFTSVSSLALWLQNGVGVTAAKWDDSSGNNNHATQDTVGKQAAVSGGGLDFEEDNEDHYGLENMITVAENGGFCIAWVMDTESATNNTLVSDSGTETIRIQNASKIRLLTNDPGNLQSAYHTNEAFGTAKGLYMLNRTAGDGSVVTIFKNGVAVAIEPSSGNSTLADAGENDNGFTFDTVGAANSGSTHWFDGKLLELAFWTKSLSATEIADVNSYLKGIHGL